MSDWAMLLICSAAMCGFAAVVWHVFVWVADRWLIK